MGRQKTMAVAGKFAADNNAAGRGGNGSSGQQQGAGDGPTHTTRSSGSDF